MKTKVYSYFQRVRLRKLLKVRFLGSGKRDQALMLNICFETYGSGLVSIEFMGLLYFAQNVQSYEEVEELAKVYHQGLCENGVKDYDLEDFLMDIQLTICEKVLLLLVNAKQSSPQKHQEMLTKFLGDEEKVEEVFKILERGCGVQPVMILTSLYVKDKDNFLIVK